MRPLALTLPLLACGCGALDSVLCGTSTCEFSAHEWDVLRSLAGLPEQPPLDTSNRFSNDPAAAALGQQLYFEPRASGTATLVDTLGRPVPYARAAKGAPLGISCATCHDPRAAGSDLTSMPNTTSIGAGWYDVNGQQTVNAAYYGITYWNGRNDSLWAQVVAVEESTVSMGSNRLALTWMLADHYRAAYDAVFTDTPLPVTGPSEALAAQVTSNGQCALDAGVCPDGCRAVASTPASCWPRFPLRGRPGTTPGCQPDSTTEPFFDAYDCMDLADQKATTQVLVNFSKAIAAYEQRLVSRDSAFDRFMAEGPKSDLLTAAQQRGARLFVGKAACVECHSTPLFSDSEFHNVGVPQEGEAVPTEADCPEGSKVCDCVAGVKCLPWGARDGLAKLRTNGFRRDSTWSDDPADTSRVGYLKRPLTDELIGAWRTPSLRDVALTAPYMHDGAYPSLAAVVEAYNTGGAAAGYSGQRSVQVQPLLLTVDEENDLVAFLGSLTGAPLPMALISKPELPP
jgi:cytochrome c peroxidase